MVVLLSWSLFVAKAWWTSKSPPRGPFSQAPARIWIEGGARVFFWDCQGLLVIAELCASKVGLLDFAAPFSDVRWFFTYSLGVSLFSIHQLEKNDGRFHGTGREAGGVIHQRAMGLIVGLFLDALCRRTDEIPELVIDVLHIAQAVALKHAFD